MISCRAVDLCVPNENQFVTLAQRFPANLNHFKELS